MVKHVRPTAESAKGSAPLKVIVGIIVYEIVMSDATHTDEHQSHVKR